MLGFVVSAASSWPESLLSLCSVGVRFMHFLSSRSVSLSVRRHFKCLCTARPLSFRAAIPPTQACSVTQHRSLLGHNRESGGVGRRLCGSRCIESMNDMCRSNGIFHGFSVLVGSLADHFCFTGLWGPFLIFLLKRSLKTTPNDSTVVRLLPAQKCGNKSTPRLLKFSLRPPSRDTWHAVEQM